LRVDPVALAAFIVWVAALSLKIVVEVWKWRIEAPLWRRCL
jgi:hypothetical protein